MEPVGRKRREDIVSDTPDEVAAIQIGILRRRGVNGRAALAFFMSRTVCALSRRAIQRAHPGISDDDLTVAFVAAHYGPELAERVDADLAARRT